MEIKQFGQKAPVDFGINPRHPELCNLIINRDTREGHSMNHILLKTVGLVALVGSFSAHARQYKKVAVISDNQPMHIQASSPNGSFGFHQMVPGNAKMKMEVTVTALPCGQTMLFDAIVKDSVSKVQRAINFGANVNCPVNGKRPLEWAIVLKKANMIAFLIECGATL